MALESSRRTQRRREAGPRKGDVREVAILDAFEGLLAKMPFSDMTIDDIASAAGLSRSSLYFYFASKEAVLSALHERTHQGMFAPVELLRAAPEATEAVMRKAVALTGDIWREHATALRTFHEIACVSPMFGEQWRANLEQHVDFLAGLIERERLAGRASPEPLEARDVASAYFWMLEHQFYDLFCRRHTRREEQALVETLTELWFRCIGAPVVPRVR